MTRTPGTHGYLCECAYRGCRERLYLNPSDYTQLRALGTVVHRSHAAKRTILSTFGEVAVVQTAFSRIGAAA